MSIIALDMETFYSRTYSLSKLTTEEYIRGSEFEVIGVSVKVLNPPYTNNIIGTYVPAEWFSGTLPEIKEFLESFEMEKHVVVAHNAMFDMAILSWVFGIRPKKIVDTLSMARAVHGTSIGSLSLAALATYYGLGVKGGAIHAAIDKHRIDFTAQELAEYGDYCINDTELCYSIFFELAKSFPKLELDLIDLTIRMFTEPAIELDVLGLRTHLDEIIRRKAALMAAVVENKKDLMSNPKFADALRRLGAEPPLKVSPTTGKITYAFAKTDEGMKELLEHENPMVQLLVAARVGVKSTLEETRTQRLIEIASRGLLPVPLRYYAAKTGRWGGDDKINLQNLTRGSAIKNCMRAPPGFKFVDSDLSQIEARVLAWLAEQNDLVEAFENEEDVYSLMAVKIYDVLLSNINKGERFVGKQTILGCGFGMGALKFKAQLLKFNVNMDVEECQRIINVYRTTNPCIPALWKQGNEVLRAIMNDQTTPFGLDGVLVVEGKKGIRLPNGLYLDYPNLRQEFNADTGYTEFLYDVKLGRSTTPTKIYGAKLVENVVQALARIVVGEQLVRTSKKYKAVLTVHDAIGSLVPEAEEETGKEYIAMAMKIRPQWALGLPLNCEVGSGDSYGACSQ